jgi:molybdenum cofactor cytidylyltransferase
MIDQIAAIILAAGRSTRMGTSKMLLPWNGLTVLESVLRLAKGVELAPIVVVSGAFQNETHTILAKYAPEVEEIHNSSFAQLEMFHSLKMGVAALMHRCAAAVIFLGDQPQIESHVVTQLITYFGQKKSRIIIPSFQMHRGHPIIIHHDLFPDILAMPDDGNLRVFLDNHKQDIGYVVVNTASILQDMDSPEDYDRIKAFQKK